jgi:hypothetical protein
MMNVMPRSSPAATALAAALSLCGLLAPGSAPPATEPARQPALPPGHPPMVPPVQPALPPGHPPMMPPGHPPLGQPAATPAPPAAEADPSDVASVDAIIAAYYESISGPGGAARDWGRFQSLFMPGARLITARPAGEAIAPMVLAPADYVRMNDQYFQRGGYYEAELHRRLEQYGAVAHAFSTYASRRRIDDPLPYSRGVNSIQLFFDGARWWIATVMWDFERPGENPLPPGYLPGAGG